METVVKAQLSKKVAADLQKVMEFDKKGASAYKRLLIASKAAKLDGMGLNKAIKTYLSAAKGYLTPSQLECVTFANVKAAIEDSPKYSELPLFTFHQITLVCNKVIKDHDAATRAEVKAAKLAAKVERQNAATKAA